MGYPGGIERFKFDTIIHHPNGTVKIAETQAGPIYRMPIPLHLPHGNIQIPDVNL